ncbi:MAG: rod shape-determining protein MreC [Acidimicrobiia bacterium]|nr:rod shape-determining protein MreC [Acidimicrobiia bacterium]NNK91369.1 rod shape-determining protein MreC [Acidimicrobiia bacterium]
MFPLRRFERSTTLFVGLLVVSLILATLDVSSQGRTASDNLRQGAQAVFSPILKTVDWVTRPVVGFIDGLSNLAFLRSENERLSDLVRELEREQADVEALKAKIAELEDILGLEPPAQLTSVTARIFANSTSDFDFVRFIDKGSEDGIVVGQPVVSEQGLVGRVTLVDADSARVALIRDPTISVAVRVERTGETGWVDGQGSGPLKLRMPGERLPVFEGDRLVTTGSSFPPDIVVASISEDAESGVNFGLVADADPATEFSRLRFVSVLIGWDPLTITEGDLVGETPPEGIPEGDL